MAIKKTKRAVSSRKKSGEVNSSSAQTSLIAGVKKVRKKKKTVKAGRSLANEKPFDEDGAGANVDETTGAAMSTESTAESEVSWAEKIRAHRQRQQSVASILDETMGVLAKCDPKLWSQRAYWMLVGLVYERLAICEDEISTGELVSLAKVLAENRRVEVRSRSENLYGRNDDKRSGRNGELPADGLPAGDLPEGIVGTVRQLYGVELEDSNHKNGNANSKK